MSRCIQPRHHGISHILILSDAMYCKFPLPTLQIYLAFWGWVRHVDIDKCIRGSPADIGLDDIGMFVQQ